MKNRLIQLAKGNIHEPSPVVKLSHERIFGILMPDKRVAYSVELVSENHVPMRLFFYSENARVTVSKNLSVVQQAKLTVEVDTTGLQLSDEIKGEITIVYNGGEIFLPYHFTVGMAKDGENEYVFHSLSEFHEFAKQDPEAAGTVFGWKEFKKMPFMADMHYQGLYATFFTNLADDHGLRNFFEAAGLPLPEVVPVQKLSGKTRREFTFAGITKNEQLVMQYRIAQALVKVECMRQKKIEISPSMREILDIKRKYGEERDSILFLAYVSILLGEEQKAKEYLLKVQDQIQKERLEQKDVYCLFLYLASKLQDDAERTDNTKKLIHKYFQEGTVTPLQGYLDYLATAKESTDREGKQNALRSLWARGFHQSVILLETVSLWENETVAFPVLSDMELRAALFGLRHKMLSERVLFDVLSHPLVNPKHLTLYMEVLYEGYHEFQNVDILQAILNVLIQRKQVGERYFFWYEEAVRCNLVMEGLYDNFLLSCPKNYEGPLPLRIVESFAYKKESPLLPLSLLYSNVLTEYAGDERITELYREKIENFALSSMEREDYSILMKPIYNVILSEHFLNEKNAKYMAELFCLSEIQTKLTNVRKVVLYYPQLEKEDSYVLIHGQAMVPVFSKEAIIAFEDEKGRRHYDKDATVKTVYDNESLRARCLLYVEDSLLLRLSEADRIVRQGVAKERELFLVTDFIKDPSIVGFYRSRLYETLVDLSLSDSMQHIDCCEFLLEAEFSDFRKEYRVKMIQSLCDRDYINAALDKALKYGMEGLTLEAKTKLLESAVVIPGYQNNEAIIDYCLELFREDEASTKILSFLTRNFTGSLNTEIAILRAARKRHQETYDMVYKVILQSFFADRTQNIDALIELYLQESNRDETAIRAYLVYKSHYFFMNGRKMTDYTIGLLRNYLRNLPIIGELALITWFSQKTTFTDEEISEVQAILTDLSARNVALSCFTKFQGLNVLPFEMMNRVVVEYRSETAKQAVAFGYVMPGRNYFHRVMQQVYPGVFVQTFVLYRREWLEYSLRVTEQDGTQTTSGETILAQEDNSIVRTGRMEDLLNLEKKVLQRDDRETSIALHSMLVREGMNEEIFGKG